MVFCPSSLYVLFFDTVSDYRPVASNGGEGVNNERRRRGKEAIVL